MSTSQTFVQTLGIRYPIIQAPMAGTSTPELAAAVTNAGGLGSLGIGANTAEQARKSIEATRALTAGPFNVNVFCHQPAAYDAERDAAWLRHLEPLFTEFNSTPPGELHEIYKSFLQDDAVFDMLLEQRPAVVSFHFGVPAAERVEALRRAGIYTMASATNLQEATIIEERGVDAIVAQGIEAGGHRGMFDPKATDERLSTLVLVRLLVGHTRLPVIAAGGIMDGHSIRAALSAGAAAAQLGTAFILCPESAASASYRAHLKSPRAAHTRLTATISGRPARGMVNRLIEHGESAGSPPPSAYPYAYDAAKQLHAAASRLKNMEFAAEWAGQGAPLAREMPAAELVSTLVQELGTEGSNLARP
ncbi:nitronate monooxygenase family protein [Bordetella sp. 15P40C-2]|uniref:NAD(P)H-dependent flavin oxidoreductase n=1 Tax=Bordetella sp. 15P40C-2 TaxID=2572246 RepID=UPI00132CBBDE|nr:nitronate monooxygenase [Bordetella sp. 15P40C-2]MVW72074.1 nitronate monooxygenase [Bordetella sp. 15P40C-2]